MQEVEFGEYGVKSLRIAPGYAASDFAISFSRFDSKSNMFLDIATRVDGGLGVGLNNANSAQALYTLFSRDSIDMQHLNDGDGWEYAIQLPKSIRQKQLDYGISIIKKSYGAVARCFTLQSGRLNNPDLSIEDYILALHHGLEVDLSLYFVDSGLNENIMEDYKLDVSKMIFVTNNELMQLYRTIASYKTLLENS